MKISEIIATKILEDIEEHTKKNFTKKQCLELKYLASCTLRNELNKWLGFDASILEFEKVE